MSSSSSTARELLAVNLAALTCSSLFYGMFLVLFVTSLYLLVARYLAVRRSRKVHSPPSLFRSTVFIAAILMWFAVTAHWITTVYRAFLAFIYFDNGQAAIQFYLDATHTTDIMQSSFLMFSILMGDSLIIHRLWVVWERRVSVVLFPICSLIALTTCSAVSLYTVSRKNTKEDIFSNPWLTSNCVLTLVTNVYCTAFITYKIWNITRVVRPVGGSSLREFLVIVMESAAIYAYVPPPTLTSPTHHLPLVHPSSWAILFTATYKTRSLLQFLVIQCAPEVVGIVNALIHTRVGLGWAVEAVTPLDGPSEKLAFAQRFPTLGHTTVSETLNGAGIGSLDLTATGPGVEWAAGSPDMAVGGGGRWGQEKLPALSGSNWDQRSDSKDSEEDLGELSIVDRRRGSTFDSSVGHSTYRSALESPV
ncbi:unnamed protein product [Mycena citricolor]|uniref:Uncharacterized protein n=1 Tax=Mycena citricolor TaxID=2018698 RepID=A0AAD2JYK4_9AGAR|nr:unnamed protein product [Mycena citricolor]